MPAAQENGKTHKVLGWFFDSVEYCGRRSTQIIRHIKFSANQWKIQRRVLKILSTERIGQIMEEYSERNLPDLDTEYFFQKSKIRMLESRRTVYVAVWKAGPLAIIPLVTAGATLLKYLPELLPQSPDVLSYVLLGLGVFVVSLSLVSCYLSKGIDKALAEAEIRLEEIERQAEDRVAAIRSNFIAYNEDLVRETIGLESYENLEFSPDLEKRVVRRLNDRFNPSSVSDMRHRHRILCSQIDTLNVLEERFLNSSRIFDRRAKTLLQEADRKRGIQHPEINLMPYYTKGLFFICAGLIRKGDLIFDFGKIVGLGSIERNFISQVFDDPDLNNPYKNVATEPELIQYAQEAHRLHMESLLHYKQIRSTIEYLFLNGRHSIDEKMRHL